MKATSTRRDWLLCPRPDPAADLRLICLPYAGGRAGIFLGLADQLPAGVELAAAELPGHGSRLREVPYPRLRPLVAHLTDQLAERVDRPFVLFGYSMGALLAFEIAHDLAARGLPGPRALFVAAAEAPHVSPALRPVRDLPGEDLIMELARFGGGQHSLLRNAELAAIMLPVLRADLSVCETYTYEPRPPLDCPLFAFGGTQDPRVPRDSLAAWRAQTTAEFSLDLLPGGHFFLDTARAAFAERLRAALARVTDGSGGRQMTATAPPEARMNALRDGLEREFRPLADKYGDDHLPRELLPGLVRALEDHGYRMAGTDVLAGALASEELARVFPALEGCLMITQACARYIQRAGSPELRARAVPRLLAGEAIGCVASTEPNHGSNNAAMETRAVLDGDEYVINGRKRWISNADLSDYAVVLCHADLENGQQGIRPVIVERERSPYRTRDLPKLGLKAFVTSEMVFEDCRVPRENLVGPEGSLPNMRLIFEGLQWSRCRMAVVSIGLAQAALDASVAYARRRRQFGRHLGEFQLIQDKIATMATEIDAARLLVHRALTAGEEGRRTDREASMAKAYATEMAVRVASEAIQIHGANGLSPDYPLERIYRDARTLTIAEGTTEIHKLVVARSVLGLSAFR